MYIEVLSIIFTLSLLPEVGGGIVASAVPFLFLSKSTDGIFFFENLDSLSESMIFLSISVGSLLLSYNEKNINISVFTIFLCILFFITDNLLHFFIFFEMMIIPLIYIIISQGNQAERFIASQYMAIYTIISSAPLLVGILSILSKEGSSISISFFLSNESWYPLLGIVAFFVNIPTFLFHSWLPKAHVEAPLEGSILLAGVLLKVGFYGLVRFIELLSHSSVESVSNILLPWGVIGSLLSALLALSSDDMKVSVAIMSVIHISIIVSALSSINKMSVLSSVVVIISHGYGSSLLFIIVTVSYEYHNSRSFLISNGGGSNSPFFAIISFVAWMASLSPPPLVGFIGELTAFISILSFSLFSLLLLSIYFVLASFLSLYIYGMVSHSPFPSGSNKNGYNINTNEGIITSVIIFSIVVIFLLFPSGWMTEF